MIWWCPTRTHTLSNDNIIYGKIPLHVRMLLLQLVVLLMMMIYVPIQQSTLYSLRFTQWHILFYWLRIQKRDLINMVFALWKIYIVEYVWDARRTHIVHITSTLSILSPSPRMPDPEHIHLWRFERCACCAGATYTRPLFYLWWWWWPHVRHLDVVASTRAYHFWW